MKRKLVSVVSIGGQLLLAGSFVLTTEACTKKAQPAPAQGAVAPAVGGVEQLPPLSLAEIVQKYPKIYVLVSEEEYKTLSGEGLELAGGAEVALSNPELGGLIAGLLGAGLAAGAGGAKILAGSTPGTVKLAPKDTVAAAPRVRPESEIPGMPRVERSRFGSAEQSPADGTVPPTPRNTFAPGAETFPKLKSGAEEMPTPAPAPTPARGDGNNEAPRSPRPGGEGQGQPLGDRGVIPTTPRRGDGNNGALRSSRRLAAEEEDILEGLVPPPNSARTSSSDSIRSSGESFSFSDTTSEPRVEMMHEGQFSSFLVSSPSGTQSPRLQTETVAFITPQAVSSFRQSLGARPHRVQSVTGSPRTLITVEVPASPRVQETTPMSPIPSGQGVVPASSSGLPTVPPLVPKRKAGPNVPFSVRGTNSAPVAPSSAPPLIKSDDLD